MADFGIAGMVRLARVTLNSVKRNGLRWTAWKISRRLFNPNSMERYGRWLRKGGAGSTVSEAARREIDRFKYRPVISVVVPVRDVAGRWLERCIESVRVQSYAYWEMCICDDASTNPETLAVLEKYRGTDPRVRIVGFVEPAGISRAANRAAEQATGEYVAFLDNDDELSPDALFEIVKALNADRSADVIYTDEDKIEPDGTYSEPYFKPDFSPEHLASCMYVLHLIVMRKSLFLDIGMFRSEFDGAQDYDLMLRASSRTRRVLHVPRVLYHWRKIPGSASERVDAKPAAADAGRRALESWIALNGLDAKVERGLLEGCFRVRYGTDKAPPVTVLIVTNDGEAVVAGRGRIRLLANLVKSIAARTDYPNYELLIVDDGELSQETRDALAGIDCRLESYRETDGRFNFSRKVNAFLGRASSEHVVILNDDTEVISGDWLRALVDLSQREDIGVVGGRLLYADGRIQHAGMVLGVTGPAAHLFHGHPARAAGYGGFIQIIRNYSAVTAACMMTRRRVFEETGGFDEKLGVDFGDVDYCLRAMKGGYRIVYTPFCEMYHFEGATSGRTGQDPEETRIFTERWGSLIENDPHYNPNLSRTRLDCSLRGAGESAASWRADGKSGKIRR